MKLDKLKTAVFHFFLHNPFVPIGLLVLVTTVFCVLLSPDLMVLPQSYETGRHRGKRRQG